MSKAEPTYRLPENHLTQEQLVRYHEGEMADAEVHLVEEHLLNCSLCSEALEGITLMDAQAYSASMAELQQRLNQRISKEKERPAFAIWQWGIAASVLLAVSVAIYFFISLSADRRQEQMAQQPGTDSVEVPLLVPETLALREAENADQGDDSLPAPPEKPVQPQQKASVVKPSLLAEVEDAYLADIEVQFEVTPPLAMEAVDLKSIAIADTAVNNNLAQRTIEPPAVVNHLQGKVAGVAVKPKSSAFAVPMGVMAGRRVEGIVYSAEDGNPLPGVNVVVKGTSIGTITDVDGKYILEVPANATLVFAYIGSESRELLVQDSLLAYDVSLPVDVRSLSEVVVTGISKRKNSVSTAHAPVIATPRPWIGMRKFRQYLEENKRFTEAALQSNVSGTVRLSFYVDSDGSLTDFKVLRSLGYGLDEEAIRLVQEGPAWKPGSRDGNAERQRVSVRISFKQK
jgi:TonB family protein